MHPVLQEFLSSVRAASLSEASNQLGNWWVHSFLDFFPEKISVWLQGEGEKVLLLIPQQEEIELQLLNHQGLVMARDSRGITQYSQTWIDEFLGLQGLIPGDVAIGVRLPNEMFFGRTLTLPLATLRSLDEVVLQDLKRKTPFRIDDVHHDHAVQRMAGGDRIQVQQWVARKELVSHALKPFGFGIERVDFIAAQAGGDPPASAPYIALRREPDGRRSWLRRASVALVVTGLILASVAAGTRYWRQQVALDALDGQIPTARAKAQKVRADIDRINQRLDILVRLRAQKAEAAGLLDILDGATRVLPSHSWLTELQVSELPDRRQRVTMRGFSAAGSSLVGLVDQSLWFTEASLIAPIAVDAVEGRERFSLQAIVKPRPASGQVP
jgi:general secretion pathway protein L